MAEKLLDFEDEDYNEIAETDTHIIREQQTDTFEDGTVVTITAKKRVRNDDPTIKVYDLDLDEENFQALLTKYDAQKPCAR